VSGITETWKGRVTMDATFSAEEHFTRGRARFEAGEEEAAFEHFRAAHGLQRASALYTSWYGLCLALVERRFNKGLELCRLAVKDEFFNPELYLNLARVHLAFGFKAEGLRYLRRGLMIDPSNEIIRNELDRLGRRQQPVLRFLPRRHPLNRLLGRVRRRLSPGAEVLESIDGAVAS
jgi:tetratricopeptide (TPR) repeat protein